MTIRSERNKNWNRCISRQQPHHHQRRSWSILTLGSCIFTQLKRQLLKQSTARDFELFLEFLGYEEDALEDKARAFAAKARTDSNYAFNSLLRFFQTQRERIERKEVVVGTVRNYAKAIKLFYEMIDLNVTWQKIMRGLPDGRRYAESHTLVTMLLLKSVSDELSKKIQASIYTQQ